MKLCNCGCGEMIPEYSIKNGRRIDRMFKHGHSNPAKRGENHHGWKGGKHIHYGYVYIHKPDHPHCDTKGYVVEHRLVMEQYLKRYLTETEEIHHINEVKNDNRIENLLLTNRKEHQSIHSTGKLYVGKRDQLTGKFICG